MLTKKIRIPIYEYDVYMYQVEDADDAEALERVLRRFHIMELCEEVVGNIVDDVEGGGVTCFNGGAKTFVTILYSCDDAEFYEATLDHEKRHIVDDLLEHCGVKDKEAAAYLSGWLTTKFKFNNR